MPFAENAGAYTTLAGESALVEPLVVYNDAQSSGKLSHFGFAQWCLCGQHGGDSLRAMTAGSLLNGFQRGETQWPFAASVAVKSGRARDSVPNAVRRRLEARRWCKPHRARSRGCPKT